MYCPQCGIESAADQRYCRSCGANLKVIAKAVTLSEAIARSDRGPLPKIKEMMKGIKVEQATDEISHALDQMNQEIARSAPVIKPTNPWWLHLDSNRTPEQRREHHITKGTISLFTGIALMIFLYYFSGALVLKMPPDLLSRIPFELEPVVRIIWLIGLIPALSGMGRLVAGLLIRPAPENKVIKDFAQSTPTASMEAVTQRVPLNVTENTTELLDDKAPLHK